MRKKILLIVLAIFVIIQFIRPARNKSSHISANDLSKHYEVPAHVKKILEVSCNDCHSNNTVYPWYTNIQPAGWWMQWHVNDGKGHLNFSEFAAYTPKRQHHKLEETIDLLERNQMPLDSYLWMHKDAALSSEQKEILIIWAKTLMNKIASENNLAAEPSKK